MSEKVAFIGLGAMGGPMALNIIKKGTSVSVFDIETEKNGTSYQGWWNSWKINSRYY